MFFKLEGAEERQIGVRVSSFVERCTQRDSNQGLERGGVRPTVEAQMKESVEYVGGCS